MTDLYARTKQLAKYLLEALDREDDPDRLAYEIRKEREDRAALDRLYVQTGQRSEHDVEAIHPFVSDDYVERGVMIERSDGAHVPLAVERDAIAEMDPTYGRNELLESDARWIAYCGRDLAIALRVPLVDAVFGVNADLVVAAAVHELAARIDCLRDTGEFEAIEQRFVQADRRATLRYAPSPANPERARFVELRVASPSGQSTTSQWLHAGSNDELAAYLCWPRPSQTFRGTSENSSRRSSIAWLNGLRDRMAQLTSTKTNEEDL